MRIVEIAALENGAHRNQTGAFSEIPEGWAVIPEDMALPDTFPFVSIAAENGIITHMSAGAVPDAPVTVERTIQDEMDSILVDHEYRLTLLELGVM